MRGFSAPIQLAIALAAIALTGCGTDRDGPAGDITVDLEEIGDSGQSGSAALSAEGEKILVVIETDGESVSEVLASTRATAGRRSGVYDVE